MITPLFKQKIHRRRKIAHTEDLLACRATLGYTPPTENYDEMPFPLRGVSPLRYRMTQNVVATEGTALFTFRPSDQVTHE
ncbi:protein of unknown function [Acidithiobacillus ferrivorans]|uniref:Uncharacterized protein n=1 Tax=Acidithiobacillus ferrivorans TaxID=160808 RepID=A0A060UMD3_9PROT|nr:hypothetical protein AFERRI_30453 [Acidithiobacillus ferrivorans]SMH66380.1 protein of unknown function [Acidithiobacillus ferrivorans]